MQLIDTHAHLYLEQFKDDVESVLQDSQAAGVGRVYMPNIDHTSVEGMLRLEENHPGQCVAMMGLHPCSVKKGFERELYQVEEWLAKRPFVAVGEIGTDLYWDDQFWPEQQEAFKVQVALARQHGLPVVIHCRDSIDQTIELVRDKQDGGLKGIFHCFSGTLAQAEQIVGLGFLLGLGGVATFKNGGLDQVVPHVGLEHMVLETDSPYLAPAPNRGKRNVPAYLPLVAERVAELKGITVAEVAQATTANALEVFKKPTP